MRDSKPAGNMLWAVLFCVATAVSFNGCGDVSNVSTPNNPPVANAGPDQGNIAGGTTITLDGSKSSDPNGNPLTFRWTLMTKPAGSNASLSSTTSVKPTFTVDLVTGDYTAQLIVNDGTVDSAPDSVTISTANVAPVANAGPDQPSVAPGPVTLDGSASSDANGDPLTYSWTFTSIPGGSAAVLTSPNTVSPTFTVDLAGSYVVQLIVNDGTVDSAPSTVTITSP